MWVISEASLAARVMVVRISRKSVGMAYVDPVVALSIARVAMHSARGSEMESAIEYSNAMSNFSAII